VCRAWKYTLENTVLFQVVRPRSTEQFDKLIEKMGREPYWRQRVERPIIEMTSITSKEIDCLPFLFSNIQEIALYQGIDGSDLWFIKLLSPHTWSKSIKRIREQSSPFPCLWSIWWLPFCYIYLWFSLLALYGNRTYLTFGSIWFTIAYVLHWYIYIYIYIYIYESYPFYFACSTYSYLFN
jgi:hypothetical protein